MNTEYKSLLPADFSDESRVWIYQANRMFTMAEALDMEQMLEAFTEGWTSHGADVKGFATLFFGQFIIIMADETAAGVSGCSTDSSVRLIRQMEDKFRVSLFDRQMLAFLRNDKIELLPLGQFEYAMEKGFLNGETVYFNNTVQTKKALLEQWMIPLKESWLARRLKVSQ